MNEHQLARCGKHSDMLSVVWKLGWGLALQPQLVKLMVSLHAYPSEQMCRRGIRELKEAQLLKAKHWLDGKSEILILCKPAIAYITDCSSDEIALVPPYTSRKPEWKSIFRLWYAQYLVRRKELVFDIDHKSMMVPLEREIELIKAYVEIEKARFGELINVEYDINPELLDMEMPSFYIQPLVENAIKHGLCKKACGGTVLISAKKNEGSVIINVNDTGVGMSTEKLDQLRNSESANEGVGFFNVSRRIKSCENARLDIQSTEGVGTTVTITVLDTIA